MVNCCILSCPSNAAHAEISFFRFPVIRADEESRRLSIDRRAAWIVAVDRKNINFDYALVCSRHFISGRPAKLNEYRHPDWIPTLELAEKSSAEVEASHDAGESTRGSGVLPSEKRSGAKRDAIHTILKHDTAKICRLCLGKEVRLTKPFVSETVTDDALLQKIYECTTVKITLKASYPASICAICDTKLTEYSKFREKCIENDALLRTVLESDEPDQQDPSAESSSELIEPLDFHESAELKDLQIQLYGSSDETTVSQSEFGAPEEHTGVEGTSAGKAAPASAPLPKITSITSNASVSTITSAAQEETATTASASAKPKTATISVKPISSLASSTVVSADQNVNDSGNAVPGTKDADKPSVPAIVGPDGRLECVVCARPFRNTYTLRRHMNLHTEENLFTCEYCGKKFNDRSNWKIHLRAHTGDNLLRCAVCFKTFISPSTLKYHLRAHRKLKVFECRLCVETTTSYDTLAEHVSNKHGDIRSEDLAKAIEDSFIAGDFLKIEMEADETSLTAAISGLAEAVELSPLPDPPPLIPAPTASAAPVASAASATSEIEPSEIKIKEEIPDDDVVEVKQEPVEDDTLEPDPDGEKQMHDQLTAMIPPTEEEAPPVILFRCDYCMKIFKYLYELRVHMKIHNGTKGPPKTVEKGNAGTPARLVVSSDPPPAKKPRHPSIDEDVGELANAPLPEHKCSKCDKCFRTEELLKVHIETHKMDDNVTQARSCKVCFKTFKCELNLVSHMRKHHPYETYVSEQQQAAAMIEDKPPSPDSSSTDGNMSQGESPESSGNADGSSTVDRKCEICALSFDCAYKLEKHVLTHFKNNEAVAFVPSADRPYKCTECHKRFKRKDYLLIHIRTHTGERRHKCDMCSSAFVHPSNLITHRKLHSNERPFKCDLCPAAFKLYAGLKIHRKRCALKYLQENSVEIT